MGLSAMRETLVIHTLHSTFGLPPERSETTAVLQWETTAPRFGRYLRKGGRIEGLDLQNRARRWGPAGRLSGHQGSHFDYFKIFALDAFEGVENLIIPAMVRGAGDLPVAAVIRQDHAVGLKAFENDLDRWRKAADVVSAFESHPHAHGRQISHPGCCWRNGSPAPHRPGGCARR